MQSARYIALLWIAAVIVAAWYVHGLHVCRRARLTQRAPQAFTSAILNEPIKYRILHMQEGLG